MSDLSVTLSVEDQRALQSLKRIQATTQQVTDQFKVLGTAIAAFASGAVVTNLMNMATIMTNLSRSTGIAMESIVGFSQAFSAAGGTTDRAADGISDLVKNIGDAARGSKELQNAFALAGVSLSDLGTLSEQDLLRKTVAGLAAMPDAARRTSTAMQIMGESVKGVDLVRLNRDLDGFTQRAGPNASAFTAAADAQKSLTQNLANLSTALTKVLEPLNKIAATINISVPTFETLIRIAVALGGAVLILTGGLSKLNAMFTVIAKSLQYVTGRGGATGMVFKQMGQDIQGTLGTWGRFGKSITDVTASKVKLRTLILSTVFGLTRFAARLTGVVGIAYSVAEAINLVVKSVTGFDALGALGGAIAKGWTLAMKALGLYKEEAKNTGPDESAAETQRLKAMNDRAEAVKRLVVLNAEEKKAIQETIRTMQASGAEQIRRINLQTSLIRATDEQRFAIETVQEAEQNYLKAIEPLLKKIQEIRDQGSAASATDVALLPTLQAGIAKISQEYQAQVPAIQSAIKARVEELQVAKELELASERLTRQAEIRAATEDSVRDIILQGQQRINDAYSEASLVGLPAIKAQLAQIAIEEEKIAQAARRRVAEQMGDDTTGIDEAMARINAAAAVITERRQQAAQQIYDEQNSFVAGWTRAFAEYATVATNAATQAQNIFSTVTKGIEDAFVNFAKTGKLSVKDLFKSIAETILRSQIQNLLVRTFGGMGGGGGGSFLGNLFSAFVGGRSAGGPVQAGRAYRVGESGPETFVPTGGGTIVPGGGSTNITYNINAVDASSFRSMIAQDPEFLFAVTEQGRRRQPSQRR
jgi:lambda family phage tail tape measure protein